MNELQRWSGVIFDPKPAFADIAARPRWWAPLVLLVLVSMLFTYLFSRRAGWEGVVRQQIEGNARFEQLPGEQRERIIEQQIRLAPVMYYAGTAVGMPVYLLILAGILALIFKVMMGGRLTFKQLFAVSAYAQIPLVLATILAILVMHLKAPEDFDIRNPLMFNVGAYLSSESPKWLKSVGSSIDLFTIWTMLLLTTGVSTADRKLGWGRCFFVILACWLVWVIAKTGFTVTLG